MVRKIIGIGGVPASGKTTLVRELMENFNLSGFSFGLVNGLFDKDKGVYFIGIFDGSTFEGTDKLSMAVQPDFIKFLDYVDGVVIFEGDRLFNQSLMNKYPTQFLKIILEPSQETLEKRYKRRGAPQPEIFLKSKRSKINNILKRYSDVVVFKNDGDNKEIIKYILDGIN